jgi:hypothetical protein
MVLFITSECKHYIYLSFFIDFLVFASPKDLIECASVLPVSWEQSQPLTHRRVVGFHASFKDYLQKSHPTGGFLLYSKYM